MNDDELLEAFESARIPIESWNHRAHVRVAWLHLRRWPPAESVARMGGAIRRLNTTHGTPESLTSAYHHTLTCGFMSAIWATMCSAGPGADSKAFCDANPHLLARTLLRLYYTRERIMTAEAKARFVAPDLAPLPASVEWPAAPGEPAEIVEEKGTEPPRLGSAGRG